MSELGTAACAKCDMCGKEVQSNMSCTVMLNDQNDKEEACWCVCPECAAKFKNEVQDFYKDIIDEEK
ncbi:hypothetical protein MFMK1_000241 [Metallumcola ferriviriculae]|uniref:Metallothionein n=1 Tax=Metallumcola ferriviriculae TaxID=3039180 RepID=A0AAU0UJ01_9FIRM|nr:hypothetical protein MFMK1_000241 [Desulfitibacteraceae bacterium MK1]